jgi:hypothetical protein
MAAASAVATADSAVVVWEAEDSGAAPEVSTAPADSGARVDLGAAVLMAGELAAPADLAAPGDVVAAAASVAVVWEVVDLAEEEIAAPVDWVAADLAAPGDSVVGASAAARWVRAAPEDLAKDSVVCKAASAIAAWAAGNSQVSIAALSTAPQPAD